MTLVAGTKLGRYEICSKIGEGGMGEVYLAQDTRLDRKVALKILPADLASNRERIGRVVREAKSAAALNHPNIATIHEIGETGQSFTHSWSPDGDKVAFAAFRNGVWNVWWISRTSKSLKQVTNYTKLNAFVRYPAWSPRGDRIVYEYTETTGNIWLMEFK